MAGSDALHDIHEDAIQSHAHAVAVGGSIHRSLCIEVASDVIGWWFHSSDLRSASPRIRGEQVMRGLRARGIRCEWFDPGRAHEYRCVVVGKRYKAASLATLETLKKSGTRIVADLCDNYFYVPPDEPRMAEQAVYLRRLLALSDHIVASTPTLADVIRQETASVPVSVIGDLPDDLSLMSLPWLRQARGLIRRSLAQAQLGRDHADGRTGLVWFGNHGIQRADCGMSDLMPLREIIESLDAKFPLSLTIISNSRRKYRSLIEPWHVRSRYFEWDALSFDTILRRHKIALIPVTMNVYTRCKSDNRMATALRAGLAVVADPLPSYLPYESAVVASGDWTGSLRHYLQSEPARQAAVEQGVATANALNDPGGLIQSWSAVLAAEFAHLDLKTAT